mmetsp:Transcript_126127/g.403637  ORF Transcript_126127/g.403637 Transcript_126127/m.403637 type:complete len:116 (-) Transcript_126127:8-355(-)
MRYSRIGSLFIAPTDALPACPPLHCSEAGPAARAVGRSSGRLRGGLSIEEAPHRPDREMKPKKRGATNSRLPQQKTSTTAAAKLHLRPAALLGVIAESACLPPAQGERGLRQTQT